MNCPKCYEPLRIADRQGIEIDYCPDCRGVWLDRGELDKIIERTIQSDFHQASAMHQSREPDRGYQEYRDHGSSKKYYEDRKKYKKGYHKPFKKKHIIKEIFDIFD